MDDKKYVMKLGSVGGGREIVDGEMGCISLFHKKNEHENLECDGSVSSPEDEGKPALASV